MWYVNDDGQMDKWQAAKRECERVRLRSVKRAARCGAVKYNAAAFCIMSLTVCTKVYDDSSYVLNSCIAKTKVMVIIPVDIVTNSTSCVRH